jgi:RNA polymerase sigma factor (sigma-70 family)
VEASAIPASVGLTRTRIAIGASLLRIRSDEQLVTLFREGNDEAFRVIHDRYRGRMFAYARQMLGASGQDPEDAVQEIFMRAYYGLRVNHRKLALRAWLYRIAHNRCVDDLRRPQPLIMIPSDTASGGAQDPVVKIEQRDALRRLISDVQRLPGPQRSALLMRELSGMSYAEVSGALGVSVPAVKSLLVRARVGLAQASEARNTACADIRADLILAHDRGVRTSGLARRHLRDCQGCREFRSEVRGVSRQLAALTPALGPIGILANLLGWGSAGAATGGGAAAGGSAVTASGTAAASGAATSAGLLAGGAGHVVTILAAAVVTAGGAVEIERTVSKVAAHQSHRAPLVATAATHTPSNSAFATSPGASSAAISADPLAAHSTSARGDSGATASRAASAGPATGAARGAHLVPITMVLDPDMYNPQNMPVDPAGTAPSGSNGTGTTTSPTSGSGTGTDSAATSSPNTPPSTTATGTSTPTSSPSSTASTTGSSTGASDSSASSSGAASGSAPSSSAASTTSAAPSSSAASSPSTETASVGHSTSSAASGTVIGLAKHRRTHRRYVLDRLGTR